MSKQVTIAVLASFDQEKAQLAATRIPEQPMLLPKSKMNCPGYKFCKYSEAQTGSKISYLFLSSNLKVPIRSLFKTLLIIHDLKTLSKHQ